VEVDEGVRGGQAVKSLALQSRGNVRKRRRKKEKEQLIDLHKERAKMEESSGKIDGLGVTQRRPRRFRHG